LIKAKIIYLLAEPLTKRDYLRFGVERLGEIFREVEIWELSAILSTSGKNLGHDHPHKVSRIQSIEELRNRLSTLTSVDELICIGIFSNMHSFRQLKVRSLVSKSVTQISAVSFASLPIAKNSIIKPAEITTFEKLRRKVSKHIIEGLLVRKFLSIAHILRQKYPRIIRVRTIDRIWYSTVFSEIPSLFIGKNTLLRAVHHFDYDLTISEGKNVSISGEQVVLIDSMGPAHPDFDSGFYLDVPDFEVWRAEVLKALDKIEGHLNSRIQIAAHPSSTQAKSTETYGGRISFLGRTCSMVRESSLVVILEGSTAVNFAVIFRRPILFVDSPIFDPRLRNLNLELSRQLQMPILRLDIPNFDFSIPEVDENLYRGYQERYIKLPNTPEKDFWSTVALDYLRYFGSLDIN
jgi:hypothetical protein